MMEAFRVISPGSFTTVQDRGRTCFIDRGVPPSGSLDPFASCVANLLAGNSAEAAVLEITMMGPALEVLCDADVALTGAEMAATVNGDPVPCWQSIRLKRGDILRIRQAKSGCRACLAVTGGIDVPVVMGSRATCVAAKIGGFEGRPLRAGDVLRRGAGSLLARPRELPSRWVPSYPPEILLRAIAGPQEEVFASRLGMFFNSVYGVTPESDRMGIRLAGPSICQDEAFPQSIVSEPVVPGNIQLPADGQPIVLLVEQTMGGYTKIATVISTDLPKLAQAVPGNRVRFREVTLEEGHEACREQARLLREIDVFLTAIR
jgi:biotin-dependent carboxylase-like uncharacterized protein